MRELPTRLTTRMSLRRPVGSLQAISATARRAKMALLEVFVIRHGDYGSLTRPCGRRSGSRDGLVEALVMWDGSRYQVAERFGDAASDERLLASRWRW